MPERASMRSNTGTERKNSSYCASLQKPITRSTPAPAAVEEHDLACRRQVRGITLKVPLRALAVVRRRERRHAAHARVQPLRDALDHAALSGRIAALEQDHHLVAGVLRPVLQLDPFALQPEQLAEVLAPRLAVRRERRVGQAGG